LETSHFSPLITKEHKGTLMRETKTQACKIDKPSPVKDKDIISLKLQFCNISLKGKRNASLPSHTSGKKLSTVWPHTFHQMYSSNYSNLPLFPSE
jgi:hypothetical protein